MGLIKKKFKDKYVDMDLCILFVFRSKEKILSSNEMMNANLIVNSDERMS